MKKLFVTLMASAVIFTAIGTGVQAVHNPDGAAGWGPQANVVNPNSGANWGPQRTPGTVS